MLLNIILSVKWLTLVHGHFNLERDHDEFSNSEADALHGQPLSQSSITESLLIGCVHASFNRSDSSSQTSFYKCPGRNSSIDNEGSGHGRRAGGSGAAGMSVMDWGDEGILQ